MSDIKNGYEADQEDEGKQNSSHASHGLERLASDGAKKLKGHGTSPKENENGSTDGTGHSGNIQSHQSAENGLFSSSNTGSQPPRSDAVTPEINSHAAGNAATRNAAAGTASAGTAGGGSAAAGTAAGAVTTAGGTTNGAAIGATVGSVAPGIGTAIGGGIGVMTGKSAEHAKKAKEANDAAQISANGKPNIREEKKQNSGLADTSFSVKLIAGIISVVFALIMLILFLTTQMIESIAAPIMAVYKIFQSGDEFVDGLQDRLKKDASFEDIQGVFISDMKSAIKKAYSEVCRDEVYQISIEQGYDIDLTMASYNNSKFPYELDGDKCNINYAELFNVISMAEKWSLKNDWKSFSYNEFVKLYEDKEFLRTLYSLRVDRAEKYIVNESLLAPGESCEIHSDKSVTITHADGTTSNYNGSDAKAYYETIVYGEVTVSSYSLLQLFDYFGIDPYGISKILPNMTNWKAMEYQEYFSRCYSPDLFWGTEERTRLIPYARQTGEITQEAGDMYMKDIFESSVITEDYVYYEVTEYKQADPNWAGRKYLDKTMASNGCCVTSMAMVISYYGDNSINPGSLLDKMNREDKGLLNRPKLSEEFGFWHYLDDNSFSMHSDLTKITGELINQRLVIAHIKPNSSTHFATKRGHWVVLHGFQRAGIGKDTDLAVTEDGSTGFFYVNDPNRNNETMTFKEAANLIDRIQSYGYR